jgi:Fe-S-cluster containining protein
MSAEGKVILELRKWIPNVSGCPKGCHKCCGPVPFSRWEWSRIKDKRAPHSDELDCPYIGKTGCDIYEERPILCRLFGVEGMPEERRCEHHSKLRTMSVRGLRLSVREFNAHIIRRYHAVLQKTGVHGPYRGLIKNMFEQAALKEATPHD